MTKKTPKKPTTYRLDHDLPEMLRSEAERAGHNNVNLLVNQFIRDGLNKLAYMRKNNRAR